MDLEFISTQLVHDMKGNGKMICRMAMVLKPGKMEADTKDFSRQALSVGKENIFGQTIIPIQEHGATIK